MTSVLIDWLTITSDFSLLEKLQSSKFNFRESAQLPRLAHYDEAFRLEPAGKFYRSSSRKQGTMAVFSGKALQVLRERTHDDGLTLAEVGTLGNVTRLDFAIDILEDLDLRDLEILIQENSYFTTFKKEPRRMDTLAEDGGYTLYFGSTKGDRQVRVYDKAIQMQILNLAWSRIELQARRARARQISFDMLENDWRETGKAAVQECLDFPACQWWTDALTNSSEGLSPVTGQEPRWQKWMRTQVEPSIINHLRSRKDRDFINLLLGRISEAILDNPHQQ